MLAFTANNKIYKCEYFITYQIGINAFHSSKAARLKHCDFQLSPIDIPLVQSCWRYGVKLGGSNFKTVDKLFIALRSLLNACDSAQIGTLVNWAQQT